MRHSLGVLTALILTFSFSCAKPEEKACLEGKDIVVEKLAREFASFASSSYPLGSYSDWYKAYIEQLEFEDLLKAQEKEISGIRFYYCKARVVLNNPKKRIWFLINYTITNTDGRTKANLLSFIKEKEEEVN